MKLKVIIIGLVALLSGIFFWQTTNRFLYPSKAAPATTTTGGGATLPGTGTASTNSTSCPNRSKGDYNCDAKIDVQDLAVFRLEYSGNGASKESDGNADGKVDLLDYDALRVSLFP